MITKEKFCKIINEIKRMHEYEDELYKLGRKYDNDSEIRFPTLEDTVVSLLEYATCCPTDEKYGSDISYFIYELDFGRDWEPGMIVDREGNDIDFSTAEKLYDYLKKVYEERTQVV